MQDIGRYKTCQCACYMSHCHVMLGSTVYMPSQPSCKLGQLCIDFVQQRRLLGPFDAMGICHGFDQQHNLCLAKLCQVYLSPARQLLPWQVERLSGTTTIRARGCGCGHNAPCTAPLVMLTPPSAVACNMHFPAGIGPAKPLGPTSWKPAQPTPITRQGTPAASTCNPP